MSIVRRSIAASLVLAADPLGGARSQEPPAPKPGSVEVVETRTRGCTLADLQFIDADATKEGKRVAFDSIPADVAFEVWLDGFAPRTITVAGPGADPADPASKVKKPVVSVLRVSNAECEEYVKFMREDAPRGDESFFLTVVFQEILAQKAMLVLRRDDLPDVEKRAQAALDKLRRGASFDEVLRVHSEDDTSRQVGGIFAHESRAGLMDRYPIGMALFAMQPNQVIGPVFDKTAAYILRIDRRDHSNNPWFDRVKSSAIVLRYTTGPGLKMRESARLDNSVRVRSEQERYLRILPPAVQFPPPKSFGPSDVAPLGKAGMPLRQRHLDDARDQKPFDAAGQGAAPTPQKDGGGKDGGGNR